jgi:hypothetical protein
MWAAGRVIKLKTSNFPVCAQGGYFSPMKYFICNVIFAEN